MVRGIFTHGIHLLCYLPMINRGTTHCQRPENEGKHTKANGLLTLNAFSGNAGILGAEGKN